MSAGRRKKEAWRPVGSEEIAASDFQLKPNQGATMPYVPPGSGSGGTMAGQAFGSRYGSQEPRYNQSYRAGSGGAPGSGPGGTQGRGGYQRRPQSYGRAGYGQYAPGPSVFYGDGGYSVGDRSQGYSQYQQQYGGYYPPRQTQEYRSTRSTAAFGERRPDAARGQSGQSAGKYDGAPSGAEQGGPSMSQSEQQQQETPAEASMAGAQLQGEQEDYSKHPQAQQQYQQDEQDQGNGSSAASPRAAQKWHQQRMDDPSSLAGAYDMQAQAQALQLQLNQATLSPPTGRWGDADSSSHGSPVVTSQEAEPGEGGGGSDEMPTQQLNDDAPPGYGTQGSGQADEDHDGNDVTDQKLSSRAGSPEVMSRGAESNASGSPRTRQPTDAQDPGLSWPEQAHTADQGADQFESQLQQDTTSQQVDQAANPADAGAQLPPGREEQDSQVSSRTGSLSLGLLDAVLQQGAAQGGAELRLVEAYHAVADEELVRLAAASALARAQALREEVERAAVFLARREIRRAQGALEEARRDLAQREEELQARCSAAERQAQESEEAKAQLQQQMEALEKELVTHRQEVEEKAWQQEGQLREKASEAAALRKERDGVLAESKVQVAQLEAERAKLKSRIAELEGQTAAKERQLQDAAQQLRSAQEELWRKEEVAGQQAQSWAAHGQDLEAHAAAMASLNQSLHAQLGERTEQCNQLFMASQQMRQQLIEGEKYYVQVIQQLHNELAELKGIPNTHPFHGLPQQHHQQQEHGPQGQHGQGEGQAPGMEDHGANQGPSSATGADSGRGQRGPSPALHGGAAPFIPGMPQQHGPNSGPDPVAAASDPGAVPGMASAGPLPVAPGAPPLPPGSVPPAAAGTGPSMGPGPHFFGPPFMGAEFGSGYPGPAPALAPGMPVGPPQGFLNGAPHGVIGALGAPGAPGEGAIGPQDSGAGADGKRHDSEASSGSVPGRAADEEQQQSSGSVGVADAPWGPQHPPLSPAPGAPGGPARIGIPPLGVPPGLVPHHGPPGFLPYGLPPGFAPGLPGLALPIGTPGPPAALGTVQAPVTGPGALPGTPEGAQGAVATGLPGASAPPGFGAPVRPSGSGSSFGAHAQAHEQGPTQEEAGGTTAGSAAEQQEGPSPQPPLPAPGLGETALQAHSPAPQQPAFGAQGAAAMQGPHEEQLQFGSLHNSPARGGERSAPGMPHASHGSLVVSPPRLLDERGLLTCLVRTLPRGQGTKLQISTTVSNRLARLLSPLSWEADYAPRLGSLNHFISSHPELFVMDGQDQVSLREGAHAIVASMPAAPQGPPPVPTAAVGSKLPSRAPEAAMAVNSKGGGAQGPPPGLHQFQAPPVGAPQGAAGGMFDGGVAAAAPMAPMVPAPHSYYNRQHGNTRGPIGQNYSRKPNSSPGVPERQEGPPIVPAPEAQYSLYGNGH